MTSALFSVAGSAAQVAQVVTHGSTTTVAIVNTAGIDTVEWAVTGKSHAATAVTITPVGKGHTATITFPADPGYDHAVLLEAKCNGGRGPTGTHDANLICRRVIGTKSHGAIVPVCANEEFERDATVGWTKAVNDGIVSSSLSINSTPVTALVTGPGTSVSISSGVATLSTSSGAFRDALPSTALQNALLAGFDASSLDHLKDGTALSAVSSLFGSRYPITQHVSGNMPTVKLGRNGKKSVNFNSTNQQRLLINGLEKFASASTYTTPITIVMRIKRGLMTGYRNIFSLCDTATTRDASFYIPAEVYRLAAYQAGVTLSYSGSRLLPYTGGNTFTIAVTFNGANSVLRYGQSEVTGALGTAVATNFSSCEIGGFSRGNDPTAHWDGDVEAIAVFAGALTSEQCNQVEDTFLRDRKWRLIVDGNSHCEGQSDQTSQMSGEIEALLGPYFSVEQQGLGGQPIATMVTNFGTNIAPRLRGSNKIIFAWEICNAINQGQTYTQITNSLKAYKALCDAQGARLAIATCMGWKDWTVGSAGYILMNQINTEILSNPTLYCSATDAVANLTRLSILDDQNNTTYFKADGGHLKSAANIVIASEIERAIKAACLS